jgi:hypothetical protein
MVTVKTKKKQYELAEQGLLYFIQDGHYVKANVGIVITQHGKLTFYRKRP